MNIALIGYGRMGREVEAAAQEQGHSVSLRIDPENSAADARKFSADLLVDVPTDGIIEFAQAQGIEERAQQITQLGKPYVLGTTGLSKEQFRVLEACTQHAQKGGAILYGSNFSIGVHVFYRLVKQAAASINALPEYDIMLNEQHHAKKKDSPSGTAISLAEAILAKSTRKTSWTAELLQREIAPHELHVSSSRGGNVPGTHSVRLDSAADSIVLRHSARTRAGFARGALRALEWLRTRQGYYTVEDFFADLLGGTTDADA